MKKTTNPIYIIASESSSEGSHTDKEMYISECIKNKFREVEEEKEEEIKNEMSENSIVAIEDIEIRDSNVDMADYMDLKDKFSSLE